MNKSEQINELAAALVKFQSNMKPVIKNKTAGGGKFSYSYADMNSIWDAIRKPLSDAGLSITQVFNGTMITTMLLHSSGQWISGDLNLQFVGGKPQELGSEITYLRRYSLTSILGICSDDDDDGQQAQQAERNGNATRSSGNDNRSLASAPQPTISAAQAVELRKMLQDCSTEFRANFWSLIRSEVKGIEKIEQLPAKLYHSMREKIVANSKTGEIAYV